MKRWIEIQTVHELVKRKEDFWGVPKFEETSTGFDLSAKGAIHSETFWADRVKQNKSNPQMRLEICLDNLPLPGAFTKAAIAARATIKEQIKSEKDISEMVKLLYRIEAVDSYCVPHCARLGIPGYNIIEMTPGAVLWNARLDYSRLGFEKFRLVNKTDAKWFIQVFGQPTYHSTMNVLYQDLWTAAEDCFEIQEQKYYDNLKNMF